MNVPNLFWARDIQKYNMSHFDDKGNRVLARPMGLGGLCLLRRLSLAWAVFTGRCDVVRWAELPQANTDAGPEVRNVDYAKIIKSAVSSIDVNCIVPHEAPILEAFRPMRDAAYPINYLILSSSGWMQLMGSNHTSLIEQPSKFGGLSGYFGRILGSVILSDVYFSPDLDVHPCQCVPKSVDLLSVCVNARGYIGRVVVYNFTADAHE